MKRLLSLFLVSIFLVFSLFYNVPITSSDELDDITKQIQDLTNSLNQSINATKPLESQLNSLQNQINGIKGRLSSIETDISKKGKDIAKGYEDLAEQEELLGKTIRDYYIKSYYNSPFIIFFSSSSISDITQALAYQRAVTDQDKAIITNIALSINDLEIKKNNLESEKKKLAVLKADLDVQSGKLDEVVSGAKNFQTELSGKIAELSTRQQQILSERSGSFTVSGNSELADDYLASIQGFKESAPSGYFAVFSFGAYSHRNGMSQYGALGRAKSGQNTEQILSAYYPGTTIKADYPAMDQITVDGKTGSFEDWYLHRIYEVPESWPKEVLKAQAIAARTYAIKYTNNGQSPICSTQSCQVFKDSPKTGAWKEAVEETRGKVLVDGSGNPVSTQYASTHGGWATGVSWDTTDGSGGSSLLTKAYDAIGGSPWLYKAWWRQGYTGGGSTCGRSNPWLSPQEMADIVNAAIALKTGGIDTSRIQPITTACWGGDPYSIDELRNLVSGHGGISSANSVSVSLGDGRTNSVNISGVSINGDDFCTAFNLRAPGYVRIPQWSGSQCGGAFFNIEKK